MMTACKRQIRSNLYYLAAVLDFRLGKVHKPTGLALASPKACTEVDWGLRPCGRCGQVKVVLVDTQF